MTRVLPDQKKKEGKAFKVEKMEFPRSRGSLSQSPTFKIFFSIDAACGVGIIPWLSETIIMEDASIFAMNSIECSENKEKGFSNQKNYLIEVIILYAK